jgi:PAS domain S-box-containing protein
MLRTVHTARASMGETPWAALRAAMDEAPDLIRISDDEDVTVFASTAATELLGFRPEELVGSDVGALDHPDDRSTRALGDAEARSSGRPVRRVHRVRQRDGRYRWLDTTARVLTCGDRTYTVLISRDATGLQELARAGRPTRERLTSLVEAISEPVVLIDRGGRIIAATSAWLALVAHPGRAVGEPIEAVCRWRFGAAAARRIVHALRRAIREQDDESLILSPAEGPQGQVSVVCTPLMTPVVGGVEEIVMVFRADAGQVPTVDLAAMRRTELLTPRERDVLLGLAEGLSSGGVAERLGIRESTVRGHIKSLLQKLQVHTQLQAVLVGLHAGVVPLDVGPP